MRLFRTIGDDSLWRDRSFVLFWIGRIFSVGGSLVTYVVLPILVYRLTGSALQTSLVTALEAVPYLLFGLPAGALADRLDRRRLMVGCDLVNAVLLGSIPLAVWGGVLTLPHLYMVAFLSATAFVWFDAANFGALPALVGRERIVEANAALWSAMSLLQIVAPALAGLLVATLGPGPTIGLDALTYLLSAVTLAFIPRAFRTARAEPPATADLVGEIREGLRYLWRHRLVRTLTLLGIGVSFSGGALLGLLVVYAVEGLGIPVDDGKIGLLFAASAVGGLIASLALPRLSRRFAGARITLYALPADAALLAAVALAPTFALSLASLLLWQAANMLVILNGISVRQLVTPDHLQGRVNTTARMIAWGGTPFGAAVGGALAEGIGIRGALLLTAITVMLSAVLAWFSPLRDPSLEAEPIPALSANYLQ